MQRRIAKATAENNLNKARRLSYLLTHSYYAKLLAVRRVTTNRGRYTPGVDGVVWKSAGDKMKAVLSLTDRSYRALPTRRVWIPKKGGKMRPLSIPTQHDRAMQTLYASALSPIAETRADARSFGFRIGRSAQDASSQLFIAMAPKRGAGYVLALDIRACFDNIDHGWLMANVPMQKGVMRKFLEAGYMERGRLFPTKRGSGQGSLISTLFSNMALDGMEEALAEKFGKIGSAKRWQAKVNLVRYADDSVITAVDETTALAAREVIIDFLYPRGLVLSEEKTHVVAIEDGFDMLGWNFRKYRGKMVIKPSNNSIRKLLEKTHAIIDSAKAQTQAELIRQLNPVIRDWARYRHPKKNAHWVKDRYWHVVGNRHWVFSDGQSILLAMSDVKIRRHPALRIGMNPYLDHDYFEKRKNTVRAARKG